MKEETNRRLESTDSAVDIKYTTWARDGRSDTQQCDISRKCRRKSENSIRHCLQALDISKVTRHHVPTKDLYLQANKIKLTQSLLLTDQTYREKFTKLIIAQEKVNANFVDEIICSDKDNFSLDDFNNRHNLGLKTSPSVCWDNITSPASHCFAWIVVWRNHWTIIFWEHPITVIRACYRSKIIKFFMAQLEDSIFIRFVINESLSHITKVNSTGLTMFNIYLDV